MAFLAAESRNLYKKRTNMEQLDWTKVINRQLKASGWSIQKMAHETKLTYSGVWQLLKRNDIQIQRLAELSEAFQYNFFRDLAEQLPYNEPDYTTAKENTEKEVLQARVQELEMELKVLKEAISLMRG